VLRGRGARGLGGGWRHPVHRAGQVLPDLQSHPVLLNFEFRQLVFADEMENLLECVEVHQSISSSSVVTSVSISTPVSVTSTSSSIRTPPHPGKYAPGSMVKTIPGRTHSCRVSTSGRRWVIRGSS